MRVIERVDEAVVVDAFLRGEIDSPRFRDDLLVALGHDERLVRAADLSNEEENAERARVLTRFRGEYLGAWFHELSWARVELHRDEVLAIRYIAWDYWLEITGGSRLPADGAAYLRARGDGERFVPGGAPLIAARADPASHLVVVEGHGRLTALAMHPEAIPDPLEILLGEGGSVRRWGCY